MVLEETNNLLCRDFWDEEIADALFQIGPLKASGTDGFPVKFFSEKWSIVKEDIIRVVKRFLQIGKMLAGTNDTSIVLIPKVDRPMLLKDFRPISLCNVIYKIVSKCMVNRLMPLLEDIIDAPQSAFIPRRMITGNALIVFECLHAINNGNRGCRKFGAYKLDLTKAYDRVDWRCLEAILRRLVFQSKWVQWIMECVTTIRYTIRLNNVMLDSFQPSRGLRQGDLLSSYLFLFMADRLSRILQHEVSRGALYELKICRNAPGMSHLLFADDTLIFLETTDEQATLVEKAL
jgi:hypothetical protein